MDITDKFFDAAGMSQLKQSVYEKESDYFNSYTQQIYTMVITIIQFMNIQKEKYIAKSNLYGHTYSDKERDDFDHEVQTKINLCSEKIKGIQDMLKLSKTKTEYAHKEIVLGCLICELNKGILIFKEFKLYRQRQKERILQLTKLSKVNLKIEEKKSQMAESDVSQKQKDDPLFQENQQLLKKYNNEIKEILSIQQQIRDISSSLQRMQEIIAHQEKLTEEILIEANESLLNIEKANKHLINAKKMNEQFGKRWGLLFFSMGIILLFYDYINA
ncbi:unnamed protein product [Paramecium sonneborni]|uniref:t-SNARE coiled-coil homology domain-containing protein n=1 Tax=Paramecium sonneborni TaxID=65129 RepID=A0A8S1QQQ5_9CILI|nr:unnamed protein product [Paramecium sonneborni]